MSRGDLETPIPLRTNDQLQILAQEFERLRQKLQEYYQGMEEKVEIRTRELRQAQAQISHQEKMASLGLMAAGIAHEIGNPLTSISSMAQVIKRKTTDEKITDYANNILKNIERISRIVRELVDFSKPSPHKEVEADINEIVNSAVSIIKYDRRSKKINFDLNLQPDLPKTVLVPDHLLQVFLNILINAVDASEGQETEIRVHTSSADHRIRIDITDQGCGIAAENIQRIFEPFFTTKGVGKGTGLGLTVSYGLIKKLQGEIKVQSEIDKGSTFTVVLPVKQERGADSI
jgi:signal transduction histidine kinase